MKKALLFIWLVVNTILAAVMSAMTADWLLGGGCTRILNHKYEPAFLSQIWGITSHIYTWAPEGTIFSFFLFMVAFVITIGLPIALTVYFWKETPKIYKKYREA